jgi:hypothetical protein
LKASLTKLRTAMFKKIELDLNKDIDHSFRYEFLYKVALHLFPDNSDKKLEIVRSIRSFATVLKKSTDLSKDENEYFSGVNDYLDDIDDELLVRRLKVAFFLKTVELF